MDVAEHSAVWVGHAHSSVLVGSGMWRVELGRVGVKSFFCSGVPCHRELDVRDSDAAVFEWRDERNRGMDPLESRESSSSSSISRSFIIAFGTSAISNTGNFVDAALPSFMVASALMDGTDLAV